MGKTGRLTGLRRHRDFAVGFATTFAAVLGVPAVVLTLSGAHFSTRVTLASIGVGVAAATLANWRRMKTIHLPVDSILPDSLGNIGKNRIRCPCELTVVAQVGDLARHVFGSATISPDKYEQLRVKNPYILACLTGPQAQFLGYFDVVPLAANFAEMFLKGKVTEKNITHEDVLSPSEMRSCSHLYVSGLAVCDPEDYSGKQNASILVWGLLKYLDHFYSEASPLAFASAVTPEGEALLSRFGLSVGSDRVDRIDGYPMYTITLSHEEIEKRLVRIADCSPLCTLDWLPQIPETPAGAHAPRRPLPAQHRLRLLPVSAPGMRRTG